MPSIEVFDDIIDRRQMCSLYHEEPVGNYDSAIMLSALVDKAPYGSDEYETEVYEYVRHLLRAIDTDQTLTEAQRLEAHASLRTLMTYNSCFDESVVWRACDDHDAELQAAEAAHDRDAFRLFGLVLRVGTPPRTATYR